MFSLRWWRLPCLLYNPRPMSPIVCSNRWYQGHVLAKNWCSCARNCENLPKENESLKQDLNWMVSGHAKSTWRDLDRRGSVCLIMVEKSDSIGPDLAKSSLFKKTWLYSIFKNRFYVHTPLLSRTCASHHCTYFGFVLTDARADCRFAYP